MPLQRRRLNNLRFVDTLSAKAKVLNRFFLWRLGVVLGICLLSSCASQVLTGAGLIYDRHNVYIKLNDFQINAQANRILYQDMLFKYPDTTIEIAVFNRDVLLVGHVPTIALREEAYRRVASIQGIRRLFNELEVGRFLDDNVRDSWITTKIRSHILANSDIDPHQFKVVTSRRVVYLMGDVIPLQATQVINYARQTVGVRRVVKLFKYYNLSDKPEKPT